MVPDATTRNRPNDIDEDEDLLPEPTGVHALERGFDTPALGVPVLDRPAMPAVRAQDGSRPSVEITALNAVPGIKLPQRHVTTASGQVIAQPERRGVDMWFTIAAALAALAMIIGAVRFGPTAADAPTDAYEPTPAVAESPAVESEAVGFVPSAQ